MRIPVIGVFGLARHGKGTVALALQEEFGLREVDLADELKERVLEWYGDLIPEHINRAALFDGVGRTEVTRAILQVTGTEIYRKLDVDYWIKELAVRALTALADPKANGLLVADVRFENEAKAIHQWGGRLVYVYRPGHKDEKTNYEHASEQWAATDKAVEMADYTLSNRETECVLRKTAVISLRGYIEEQQRNPTKGVSPCE